MCSLPRRSRIVNMRCATSDLINPPNSTQPGKDIESRGRLFLPSGRGIHTEVSSP